MEWARNCPAGHGGYIGSAGQNMHWFGWPPTEAKLRRCIFDFWNECNNPGYDYWTDKPVTGRWKDTAHYTIQDDAFNVEVGCGFVNCNGKASTLVCNINNMPSSSRLGDFVEKKYLLANGTRRLYEIGAPCTGCRSGTGWCYKGLCVDTCPAGTQGNDCVCGLEGQCVNGKADSSACHCECDQSHAGHLCDRDCQNFGSSCNADSCNDPFKARVECAAYCNKCTCRDHGKCVHGSFDTTGTVCGCVCTGGWEGKLCDQCTQKTCENGGVWNPQTCSCDCTGHWRGPTCTRDCKVGDPNEWPCSRFEESGVYSCPNSWYRNQCHTRCYPDCKEYYLRKCNGMTEIPPCVNGNFNTDTCQCDCSRGWQGELCDTANCSVSKLPSSSPCSSWDRTNQSPYYKCSNSWFSGQCWYNCNADCKAAYLKKCPGVTEIPFCGNGNFNPDSCKCDCSENWLGDQCDTPDCSVSTLPNNWPCSSWDRTNQSPYYKCSNSWFSGQCWYNCQADCKAKYLENCPGVSEIPECSSGQTFDPNSCACG